MDLLELMKTRRSIRKYLNKPIPREVLEDIAAAGLYAPNPGGRQGTRILIVDDREAIDRLGVINANCENRNWDTGVSSDQPSIIDDKSIKSGFYGCQALAIISIPREYYTRVNQIGSAFIVAQNMALEAYDRGVSSVIVGRAEATFQHPEAQQMLSSWAPDDAYAPICFVCLGYIDGPYPKAKPRHEGRYTYVGSEQKR